MLCPACGAECPYGKRFCADCGTALGASCPNCGATALAGKRFCGDCGAPLDDVAPAPMAAPGPTSSARPLSERRLCSVLFVDLVGFTPLSESKDPEEVREI